MELDSCEQVGQMGPHISPNVLFRQDKVIYTTSPSQDKEVHFFGMHISTGKEQQSMVPLLSCPNAVFLIHFPNPTSKK